MTVTTILIGGAINAAAIGLLMWIVHRRQTRTCAELMHELAETQIRLGDASDALQRRDTELEEARAAVRDLDAALQERRGEQPAAPPQTASERASDLIARMEALEIENAQLRDGGTREELLRARETNARLASEVDRLMAAELAREQREARW